MENPHISAGVFTYHERTRTQKPSVPNAFSSKLMLSGTGSFNIKNDAW
jgi:hypothetical protein